MLAAERRTVWRRSAGVQFVVCCVCGSRFVDSVVMCDGLCGWCFLAGDCKGS